MEEKINNIPVWLPLGISAIALLIAFWQGYLAKQQLEQAKETKSDTEKLLDEIKEKVLKIESISDETRRDVKEQISKLIDKQDENFKTLLKAPSEKSQNEMIAALLPAIMQSPDGLEKIIELGKKVQG